MEREKDQKKIPRGILIITILTIISGIILLLMFSFSLLVLLPFGPTALMGPAFLLALGIASIITAFGLYKGKGWSWTLLLVLSGFGAAGYLMNVTHGQFLSIIGIVINAIIIYYLYTPKIRKYFGKGYSGNYSNNRNNGNSVSSSSSSRSSRKGNHNKN